MTRSVIVRTLGAAMGGAVVGFALFGGFSNLADGLSGMPGAAPMIWVLPAVTAVVATALVRIMGGDVDVSSSRTPAVECPECQGLVRADWRLCPHCGVRLLGSEHTPSLG